MVEHDVLDLEAAAWLRRARRLRKASNFDAAERQALVALAEDCEAIACRIGVRRRAANGTPMERDDSRG